MKEATVNFNPFLKPWVAPQPNNVAGKGQIEIPEVETGLAEPQGRTDPV